MGKKHEYVVIYKRARGFDVPLGTFTRKQAEKTRNHMIADLGYAHNAVKIQKLRKGTR